MTKFWVEHPPVPQPRPRVFSRGGRTICLSNPKGSRIALFKAAAAEAARAACPAPLTGPVRLFCIFQMPRPKRKLGTPFHCVRPDLDNLVKALKDALTGIAWLDDKQVCALASWKLYAGKDGKVGVQVEVEEPSWSAS